ncbi:MAG: SUF system NifU family Fe-S cluster assembly protein [Deltaproteobacteria bacterium]|jgi:nitrogen fixation NifU-like protein|nr:SUF system NifU family Fe-S cluster assembly protein [Deltaproteobacteria bacterium]MBW2383600.1 SUF system NifU family Fe-S cluster assembly protein [Deltaproteobacteria bacterium]
MDELRDLYQATILDHNKKPRNFGALENADRKADGHNPLCGDKLTVYLELEDDRVVDVAFEGAGCAISTASASLMTERVKGRRIAEIEEDFCRFHELVTSAPDAPVNIGSHGKLAVFSGVREYPMRVKCATLAWHTLRAAIGNRGTTAKTE